MATIVSAATGNFNAGATWVGGVVPTVGDVAQVAATHVVTITANATCGAIESLNTSGYFVLNDGVTLTATVRGGATAANNYVLQYSGTTSATIVGDVQLTQSTASAEIVRHTGTAGTLNITGTVWSNSLAQGSCRAINIANNGKLNLTGDITWTNQSGTGSVAVLAGTGVTITVDGNVTGGGGGTCHALSVGGGTTTITGNVTGGGSSADGISAASGTHTITVTGNVTGGSSSGEGIQAAGTTTLTVTGAVTGGSGTGVGIDTGTGVTLTVNGNVTGGNAAAVDAEGPTTINGNVTGGTGGSAFGLLMAGTAASTGVGIGRINGTCTASANTSAVSVSADSIVQIDGSVYASPKGRNPLTGTGRYRFVDVPNTVLYVRSGAPTFPVGILADGVEEPFVEADDLNSPAEADVRSGTVYFGGTKTGTLAVPAANQVAVGIAVDNTVGTAALLAADVADLVGTQIAAAVSAP